MCFLTLTDTQFFSIAKMTSKSQFRDFYARIPDSRRCDLYHTKNRCNHYVTYIIGVLDIKC